MTRVGKPSEWLHSVLLTARVNSEPEPPGTSVAWLDLDVHRFHDIRCKACPDPDLGQNRIAGVDARDGAIVVSGDRYRGQKRSDGTLLTDLVWAVTPIDELPLTVTCMRCKRDVPIGADDVARALSGARVKL